MNWPRCREPELSLLGQGRFRGDGVEVMFDYLCPRCQARWERTSETQDFRATRRNICEKNICEISVRTAELAHTKTAVEKGGNGWTDELSLYFGSTLGTLVRMVMCYDGEYAIEKPDDNPIQIISKLLTYILHS